MEHTVTQDNAGTHIDWSHDGVTARMIDWFWSNMEKCFLLWHPEEHEPLTWEIAPLHGNLIGAIHLAPQTWSDGTRQNLYIRFEDLADVSEIAKQYLEYEHAIVVAGLGFGPECMVNPQPMGYRVHQWQSTDSGVVGKSHAIGTRKKETKEEGMVWAKHCLGEVGNWGVFLPQLYSLYRVVKNTDHNPYTDLSITGKGVEAQYKYFS
ncbi:MAG: hypothetical protein KC546_15900 [Anaerolineae bacterium]|nr:hypothetical protein [Anaerolineae bacterium]MCA9894461.1 hypothetical protein [Anaerolineae bacterium]